MSMKFEKSKLENIEVSVNKQLEDIIPKLSAEKFAALKADIFANGLKQPVGVMITGETTKGYTAVIVDGHHRNKAMTELGKRLTYPETITILDIATVEEALEYSFEINFQRRQLSEYQQAKWALSVYGAVKSHKELASKVGVSEGTVSKVEYITKISIETTNNTEQEKNQIEKMMKEVESDETGFDTVYKAFKTATEVSEAIANIEYEEIQTAMQKQYEVEKYTDKNAVKDLAEDVRLLEAEKAGKTFEATPYDKDLYPVMVKLCKLEDKYSSVNTVTTAGSESAIANAEESVRKFLMNNMDEAITDIQEGVRQILEEILVEKQIKDLSVIMAKVKEILPICKNDYFVAAMQVPNNPKGVVE